jgi:hypothetical protein
MVNTATMAVSMSGMESMAIRTVNQNNE